MPEQPGRTIGTVVAWRVVGAELRLTIELARPVDNSDLIDSGAQLSNGVDVFTDGSPLGTKIDPRFDGHRESGRVEVSVFDPGVEWADGVAEANGPRFIGQVLTLAAD